MTEVTIMIMSGVDDGRLMAFHAEDGDGLLDLSSWTLSIGRHNDRDIRLQRDTFISRDHAQLIQRDRQWWLTDLGSRNGTFIEQDNEEIRVHDTVQVMPAQLFKIGRTWLRIQPTE